MFDVWRRLGFPDLNLDSDLFGERGRTSRLRCLPVSDAKARILFSLSLVREMRQERFVAGTTLLQRFSQDAAAAPPDMRKGSALPSSAHDSGSALKLRRSRLFLNALPGRPKAFRTSGGIARFWPFEAKQKGTVSQASSNGMTSRARHTAGWLFRFRLIR
jgi:hypothetical protein